MTLFDQLFYALHVPLIPAWGLLFFAPHAQITRKFVHSALIPFLLGLAYLGFLITGTVFGQSADGAGMNNLAAVMTLFSHPIGTLTGWAHFLAFDLFIAAWIVRDAKTIGLSHAITLPALVFSLLFGPIGLMIYLVERAVVGKKGLVFSFPP